jgi:hypothetical protein
MWTEIFWSVIVLLIVVPFVWRFVSRMWTPRQPIEPAGEADILADLQPRPTLNSGAVALDEPDDELDGDSDVSVDAVRNSRPSHKIVSGQSALET